MHESGGIFLKRNFGGSYFGSFFGSYLGVIFGGHFWGNFGGLGVVLTRSCLEI